MARLEAPGITARLIRPGIVGVRAMVGGTGAWRAHGLIPVALLLCILHFSSFDYRNAPLVTDARYYVYFAWRINEGDVLHADLFDNKTQLTSYAGALLYALGDGLGVDPLMAIRLGYLALSALGGMLVFVAFRRLAGSVAGLLALLAYTSFGFLGLMASIGNLPKLWMPIAASAAALLVHRSRWFWAGLAGGLSRRAQPRHLRRGWHAPSRSRPCSATSSCLR